MFTWGELLYVLAVIKTNTPILLNKFFFGLAKAGSGNKGFSINGFYVGGSTVYQTDHPPKSSKV